MKNVVKVLAFGMAATLLVAPATATEGSAYPECSDKEIDYVTYAISDEAGACASKTKYDFVSYPAQTEEQLKKFCTECLDLVKKLETLAIPRCSIWVFGGGSMKEAISTLVGGCGAKLTEAKAQGEHEYPAGRNSSDELGKNNSSNASSQPAPVPTPSSGAGSMTAPVAIAVADAIAAASVLA
nr:elicitin-like protein [Pythium porphyrae]